MLTKMRWLLVFPLIGLLIFSSCGKKTPTGPEGGGDNITITSVTPNSGLTAGIVMTFVVNVEYTLASKDSGELNVGFNSALVDKYSLIATAKALVAKGSGTHQFNVTVVPRDWGAAGDFDVYVNLSENPHGPSWTPLATDTQKLSF